MVDVVKEPDNQELITWARDRVNWYNRYKGYINSNGDSAHAYGDAENELLRMLADRLEKV